MGELIFLLLILYLVFRSYVRAKRRRWEYEEKRRRSYQNSQKHLKPKTSLSRTITLGEALPKGEAVQETLPLPPAPPLRRAEEERTLTLNAEKIKERMDYPKGPPITSPEDVIKEGHTERRYAEKVKKANGERKIAAGELYKGVIYAEILGPPRAKKPWFPINGAG